MSESVSRHGASFAGRAFITLTPYLRRVVDTRLPARPPERAAAHILALPRYVADLETRLARAEALLKEVCRVLMFRAISMPSLTSTEDTPGPPGTSSPRILRAVPHREHAVVI